MDKVQLTARSPLGGAETKIGHITLREVTDVCLISIAVPRVGEAALADKLKSAFGLSLPSPKDCAVSGSARLVRMAAEQYFLLSERPASEVAQALDGAGYLTDQTDNWMICALSGPGLRAPLERIVPVDVSDAAFPVGAFARTSIEHMGAAVIRVDEAEFWLMSASSSAQSFWHAVEVSLRYTSGSRA